MPRRFIHPAHPHGHSVGSTSSPITPEPVIYFQDGFESGDFTNWVVPAWGAPVPVVNINQVHGGTYSYEQRYQIAAGGNPGQDLNRWIYKVLSGLSEVYTIGWVYLKTPEVGLDPGVYQRKLWEIGSNIPGGGLYTAILTSETNTPNADEMKLRLAYQTVGHGSPSDTLSAFLSFDTWHHIVWRLKMNTVTLGVGNQDGESDLWIDGGSVYSTTSEYINGDSEDLIDSYAVGRQVQRSATDAVDEYRYWDQITIADSYIGP